MTRCFERLLRDNLSKIHFHFYDSTFAHAFDDKSNSILTRYSCPFLPFFIPSTTTFEMPVCIALIPSDDEGHEFYEMYTVDDHEIMESPYSMLKLLYF